MFTRLDFWGLTTRYPQGRCADFNATSKYVVSRKSVQFGVQKTKLYILPHFHPQNGNFRTNSGQDRKFSLKRGKTGDFISQHQ